MEIEAEDQDGRRDGPEPGQVETRQAEITTEQRRIRGVVPFGVESRDMGGWREVIEPTALRGANLDELIARVDHAGVPIGRFPKTLDVDERSDGLHWSVTPPESRADLLEAIERGDLHAGSWQMVEAKDRWDGEVRHVEQISELRDVSVVSSPAYPTAQVEYRAAPTTKETVMPDSTPSVPAEEARVEDKKTEERSEVKVINEPEPVLQVEDRSGSPMFYSLADAFKQRGFPAQTATLEWGEARALTFGGTVDNLSPVRRDGVALGADTRYVWPAFPSVGVGSDVTSVSVFRQSTRTLGTASDVVRSIAATTTKPSAQTAGTVTAVSLSQVAAIESGIPNVYLESQGMASIVESDLRLTMNGGLDLLVTTGLATAGTVSKGTFDVLNAVRRGITAVTAGGYTPDVLQIDAAGAEALDLFRDGASPGQYVFGPGHFAPGQVFGLNVRVTTAAGTAVVDSSAFGSLYVSPISLARFEENAGATNTSTVRLEGHAAFGVERTSAAARIMP
jgi:phage head maturation protease